MLDAVELLITLPLLFGLLHFMTPAVRYISCYSRKMQCQFGVIPVLYYVFDYLTRVYTDLFVQWGSGCRGIYAIYLLWSVSCVPVV